MTYANTNRLFMPIEQINSNIPCSEKNGGFVLPEIDRLSKTEPQQ